MGDIVLFAADQLPNFGDWAYGYARENAIGFLGLGVIIVAVGIVLTRRKGEMTGKLLGMCVAGVLILSTGGVLAALQSASDSALNHTGNGNSGDLRSVK